MPTTASVVLPIPINRFPLETCPRYGRPTSVVSSSTCPPIRCRMPTSLPSLVCPLLLSFHKTARTVSQHRRATVSLSARPNALTTYRVTNAAYAPKETVASSSVSGHMERVPNECNASQLQVEATCQAIGNGSLQRVFSLNQNSINQSNVKPISRPMRPMPRIRPDWPWHRHQTQSRMAHRLQRVHRPHARKLRSCLRQTILRLDRHP